MRIRDKKNLFAFGLALLMTACAQNPPAPVEDMTRVIPSAGASSVSQAAEPPVRPGHYVVEAGDTLYSLAFDNQLDWKQLAQWNGIGAPYTIVPGQDLRLTQPPASQTSKAVTTYGAGSQPTASKPVATQPVVATSLPKSAPIPDSKPAQPSTVSTAATPAAPAADTPPTTAPPAGTPNTKVVSTPARTVAGLSWHWPADGQLLSTYVASDPTRQGIDIGGRRGSPVRAAANGVVVYSGNGLVGYGELVIVKHSDTYLSAYGHNDKRLVKEGEQVKAGQKIATMGSSGTNRTELHFEIRKHGQPIDPQGFLPRK